MFGLGKKKANDYGPPETTTFCQKCGVLLLQTYAQRVEVVHEGSYVYPPDPWVRHYCTIHKKNYDRVVHRDIKFLLPGEAPIQYLRKVAGVPAHYVEVPEEEATRHTWHAHMVATLAETPKPKAKKAKSRKGRK